MTAVTDRTAATEQEFRDRIAAFESAPTPPEVREAALLEEVARALNAVTNPADDWDDPSVPEHLRDHLRTRAAAAIAEHRAAQDELARRMRALADNLNYYASKTTGGTYAGGLTDAAGQIREALR